MDDFLGKSKDILDSSLSKNLSDAIGDFEPPPMPDLPRPKMPNIFDLIGGVSEKNPAKPTGDTDPSFEQNSFDAGDIKGGAPEIPFNDDPTGGYDIVDPLAGLPADGSDAPKPNIDEELPPHPLPNGVLEPPGAPQNDAPRPMPGGSATPPGYNGGSAKHPR